MEEQELRDLDESKALVDNGQSLRQREVAFDGDSNVESRDEQLNESSRALWFQKLIANSSGLITVVDDEANVIVANQAQGSPLGYDPESQVGLNVLDYVHRDDFELASSTFSKTVQEMGSRRTITIRFMTASGEWRFLESVFTNCLDDPTIQRFTESSSIVVTSRRRHF